MAIRNGAVSGPGAFGADPGRRRLARFTCLAVGVFGCADLAILTGRGLSENPPTAGFDLSLLLEAGRRVAAGGSPYDPNAVPGGLSARDLFYSYPPAVAQAMAPFSSLPTWLVLTAWCIGAVAGLVVVAALLARSPIGRPVVAATSLRTDTALRTDAALLALTAVLFFPFLGALVVGNADAWYPLLFGAATLALPSTRAVPSRAASVTGGVALAVASAIKLHPATLLVWLACRWPRAAGSRNAVARALGAAVAAGLAILAASLILGGMEPWRQYVDYLGRGGNAQIADRLNIGSASQFALLAGDASLAHPLAVAFAVAALAVTVAAALLIRDSLESFGWALAASLVVLPVTWYHYAVALIPIALAAWTRSRGSSRGRRVTLALIGAYVAADAAVFLPVALWLAVVLILVAARLSRPQGGLETIETEPRPAAPVRATITPARKRASI